MLLLEKWGYDWLNITCSQEIRAVLDKCKLFLANANCFWKMQIVLVEISYFCYQLVLDNHNFFKEDVLIVELAILAYCMLQAQKKVWPRASSEKSIWWPRVQPMNRMVKNQTECYFSCAGLKCLCHDIIVHIYQRTKSFFSWVFAVLQIVIYGPSPVLKWSFRAFDSWRRSIMTMCNVHSEEQNWVGLESTCTSMNLKTFPTNHPMVNAPYHSNL